SHSIDDSINSVLQKFKSDGPIASKTRVVASKSSASSGSVKLVIATKSKICGMCHKSDQGGRDELITCSVCGLSGHSKCLGCSDALLKRIKEFPNWECPNCKKCPLCGVHDDETNLICNQCDRGFHRRCLKIAVSN